MQQHKERPSAVMSDWSWRPRKQDKAAPCKRGYSLRNQLLCYDSGKMDVGRVRVSASGKAGKDENGTLLYKERVGDRNVWCEPGAARLLFK